MHPYLEKFLLNLKQEKAKNKKITNTKIVMYDDGIMPTMELVSSY